MKRCNDSVKHLEYKSRAVGALARDADGVTESCDSECEFNFRCDQRARRERAGR